MSNPMIYNQNVLWLTFAIVIISKRTCQESLGALKFSWVTFLNFLSYYHNCAQILC